MQNNVEIEIVNNIIWFIPNVFSPVRGKLEYLTNNHDFLKILRRSLKKIIYSPEIASLYIL